MAHEQCSNEANNSALLGKCQLLDSSAFSPEESNDFGAFVFDASRKTSPSIRFSNEDCTVEWMEPCKAAWIPIQTKTMLHSDKWRLEFIVELMGTRQIGVGFLLDHNTGPDWEFFGYLGYSDTAWAYDPTTGDIVTNTRSICSKLPKFTKSSGVIGLELDLPRNDIGQFTFVVDGTRTPTIPLSNSGAVAVPAVCLLCQGQKVTIGKFFKLEDG